MTTDCTSDAAPRATDDQLSDCLKAERRSTCSTCIAAYAPSGACAEAKRNRQACVTVVARLAGHLRERLDGGAPVVRVIGVGPVGGDVVLRAVATLPEQEAGRVSIRLLGRVRGRAWRATPAWVRGTVHLEERSPTALLTEQEAGVVDVVHLGDHIGRVPFHDALQITKLARRVLRPDGMFVTAQQRLTLSMRLMRLMTPRIEDYPRDTSDISHLLTMAGLCRAEFHSCEDAKEPLAMAIGRPDRRRLTPQWS